MSFSCIRKGSNATAKGLTFMLCRSVKKIGQETGSKILVYSHLFVSPTAGGGLSGPTDGAKSTTLYIFCWHAILFVWRGGVREMSGLNRRQGRIDWPEGGLAKLRTARLDVSRSKRLLISCTRQAGVSLQPPLVPRQQNHGAPRFLAHPQEQT